MRARRPRLLRHTFRAMGSPCDVQLFARRTELAELVAQRIVGDVERLEALYSRYRPESFLSRINRVAAQGGVIEVDAETAGLLDYAAACHEQSAGLFDVTSGLLRRAWHFDSGSLPDPAVVSELLERVGWHRVRWSAPRLEFTVAGMEIDFGGIVKEYAADRAATICREADLGHGVVNLGGDIRVIGPRADGSAWRIGIRHPRRKDALLCSVELCEGALASSGDYERCIEIDGVRYGHILDPRTGWPVRQLAAVSVVAELCVVAGSASTIAMLKAGEGPRWLEQLGIAHLWVDVEGRSGGPLIPAAGAL